MYLQETNGIVTYEKIKEEIKDASLVLVGLGEELTGELSGFYK